MAVSNGQWRFSEMDTSATDTSALPIIGRAAPSPAATTASSYADISTLRTLADVAVDFVGDAPDLRNPQGAEISAHRWQGTAFGYHSSTDDKTLVEQLFLLNAQYFNGGGVTNKVAALYLGSVEWTFGTESVAGLVYNSNQYVYAKSVAWTDSGLYEGLVAGLVAITASGAATSGQGGAYLSIPDVPGFAILRVPQSTGTDITNYTQAFRAWL